MFADDSRMILREEGVRVKKGRFVDDSGGESKEVDTVSGGRVSWWLA